MHEVTPSAACRRVVLAAAAGPFVAAVLALVAWISGALRLASLRSDYIPMAPSTGLCFVVITIALVAVACGRTARLRRAAGGAAALLMFFAVAKLVDFFAGSVLMDLEASLVARPGNFGAVPLARMSPLTALALAFSGAGVVGLAWRRTVGAHLAGLLGAFVAIEGATVGLGYVYRAPLLYGGQVIPMALTTAVACMGTGVAVVFAAGPGSIVLRPFSGQSARARLLRLFLPLTLLPVLLNGILTNALLSMVHANPALLAAVFALLFAAVVGVAVSSIAHKLGRDIDRARVVLEASHQELEQRVTDRTHALQAAQARAEDANRAKSEFLSRMSHDLRTPLNAVLGFAQLLQLGRLNDDDRESVGQILKGGRHLLDLINEVLDIARIEAGRLSLSPEPVSMPAALHHAANLIRPLADSRRLSLIVEAPAAGEPYVLADGQRLQQVLVNLLSNAVKYNRDAGEIRLQCSTAQDRVQVSVSDTGFGIHPLKLNRMFKPFERLGAEQLDIEGTGLGLALSKSLVEAMQGSIGVESELDRGSCFWFELPRSHAPAVAHDTADMAAPTPDRQATGVVLYVEDNLDNVRLMQRVMARRSGVELLHAADGLQALELASARRPHLVLLDLHLPDMPGQDVLRHLQDNPATRRLPVVVLSADATAAQKRALLEAGAKRYLTKPFSVTKILAVLDEMLPAEDAGDAAPGLGQKAS